MPGLYFNVPSKCDWLQCFRSECCCLAPSFPALSYHSGAIVSLAVRKVVNGSVLRLYKVEISLLTPPGEEFLNHPLLRQRRPCKVGIYKFIRHTFWTAKSSSSTVLLRYIVLGRMCKQFALFVVQFVHISAIRRCFLNIRSMYVLEPLRNQKCPYAYPY